jgi:hypothetical protein
MQLSLNANSNHVQYATANNRIIHPSNVVLNDDIGEMTLFIYPELSFYFIINGKCIQVIAADEYLISVD